MAVGLLALLGLSVYNPLFYPVGFLLTLVLSYVVERRYIACRLLSDAAADSVAYTVAKTIFNIKRARVAR